MITRRTLGFSAGALGAAALLRSRAYAAGEPAVDASKVPTDITAKATGKKWEIATVVKVDGIAWFDRMRQGVTQFGQDTGHEAWEVGPSQADAAAQVQLVETLIAQGVDAICIVPFSVEAVEPVLQKARNRGILVVAHEASNLQNADYIIEAFDNRAYGAALMQELGRLTGGEGPYVGTVGSLTSQSHMEWMDGAVAYQKANFPKMQEVTSRVESYDDEEKAYQKLKEVLTAHPDLRGIIGCPMPASAGAGRLIAERRLAGKLMFSGTGLVSVAGKYLQDGDIEYIQFWDPAVAGYAMSEIAATALAGHKDRLKAGGDLGLTGYTKLLQPDEKRPGLLYGAGWIGVTKANMGQYNF
jgi:simple sugar transport system substrate-binding protein